MTATAITHARVFDGEQLHEDQTVVIDQGRIVAVGGAVPADADVMDATGSTLLPGLIDAHVHTSLEGLALALRFGVTTELEMQGTMTASKRAAVVADDDAVADVRSSGFGITPPGGHPSELMPATVRSATVGGSTVGGGAREREGPPRGHGDVVMPFSRTPQEAVANVRRLKAAGSDYIKFMIDDGTVEGSPGLPVLDAATVTAGVAEAHRLGLLAVAHALTIESSRTAIRSGVDGLVHVFMDQPHTQDIVDLIAASGAFVVPCVVLNASMMGISGAAFAADPRVSSRLNPAWLATIRGSYDRYPYGDLDDVLASAKALHDAGVDMLTGTDVAVPLPVLGGMAHGASVHHELQLLVRAGLSPLQALRTATSVPARRFGLGDRGRITAGLRADLILVAGDPTTTVSDTLNLRQVWRRGVKFDLAATS